jgi:predicted DCC family thiol-disulfide oxidoreductase YuxK
MTRRPMNASSASPEPASLERASLELAPATAPSGSEAAFTVFYDGACPLCTAEIGFYRRRRGADRISWVDVSACATETVTAGLTRDQALKRFHARQADGRLVSGGAAFVALWSVLPSFSWLGRLFRAGPLLWGIERAYDSFLGWRPKLQGLARRFLKTQ